MFINSILLTFLWGWFYYYHPILWWENSGTEVLNNLLKITEPDQGFESVLPILAHHGCQQEEGKVMQLFAYTESSFLEPYYVDSVS